MKKKSCWSRFSEIIFDEYDNMITSNSKEQINEYDYESQSDLDDY